MSCLLCRTNTLLDEPVCNLCMRAMPIAKKHCTSCGIPIEANASDHCAQCLQKKPLFDTCYSAFNYEYPLDHLLKQIKHQQQLIYLPPLVKQLREVLIHQYDDTAWPQMIIPVPLHTKRLRTRGFDQSLLLARQLSKALRPHANIPVNTQLIKRHRKTASQQGLSASERRKNIKNAFSLAGKTHCNHLAIIDDVVTTGSTVSEITRLLKKQGVKRVDIWCLARTPEHH
nr:phosphoribosyltransferase family protein [Endozoicomonas arenosclerae]